MAGAAGGLAGAWVMNQFQRGLSELSSGSSAQQGDGDDATMKAAAWIAKTVDHRRLTKAQKQVRGPIIHYLFGVAMGAMYGAIGELGLRIRTGGGAPFGAALWLGADEVAVPALGLSKSPLAYPLTTHASALASHAVYGATLETVRRLLRAALGG